MGKNSYNGGGTIVHAGSGFFSHKGGGIRKRKPAPGADQPGAAKPGSICDFGPLKRNKKRVVKFPKKTKQQKDIEKQQDDIKRLQSQAKVLIGRAVQALQRTERQIISLRSALQKAELENAKLSAAVLYAKSIDIHDGDLSAAMKKFNRLLNGVAIDAAGRPQKQVRKKGGRGSRKQHTQTTSVAAAAEKPRGRE